MDSKSKLMKILIAGSLISTGLMSCRTYERCPAYKSYGYANKSNIEIKKQNYVFESENRRFSSYLSLQAHTDVRRLK